MEHDDTLVVYTTTPTEEEALGLARLMVEMRLAACAQAEGPVTSFYWWEGKIQQDQEWRVWFKTTQGLFDPLAAAIEEHHSYDVPQIVGVPAERISAPYRQWLRDNLPT